MTGYKLVPGRSKVALIGDTGPVHFRLTQASPTQAIGLTPAAIGRFWLQNGTELVEVLLICPVQWLCSLHDKSRGGEST